MNRAFKAIILFVAQGACAGRVPFAPGTAGTVVGVLLFMSMKDLFFVHYLAILLFLFMLGTWAASRAEVILAHTDSPSIVIDEIAGYLVAMCTIPSSWALVIAGFILFRVFDILKPWPLKRLQDLHGGIGVMLDDVGAGIYANIVLQAWLFYNPL
jgi:phosphatidylglycerophosphatase A